MSSQGPGRIIDQIWQASDTDPSLRIFALLDGARDTRIYSKLAESKVEAVSLFRGQQAEELAMVAPYLVPISREGPLTEWLITYGWGNNWGILIEAPIALSELRRHLQSFVMAYGPDGKPMFFRYYDPRVFRVYLPTCNESELKTVFGPVKAFYVEDSNPGFLMHYSLAAGKLVERKVRYENQPAASWK